MRTNYDAIRDLEEIDRRFSKVLAALKESGQPDPDPEALKFAKFMAKQYPHHPLPEIRCEPESPGRPFLLRWETQGGTEAHPDPAVITVQPDTGTKSFLLAEDQDGKLKVRHFESKGADSIIRFALLTHIPPRGGDLWPGTLPIQNFNLDQEGRHIDLRFIKEPGFSYEEKNGGKDHPFTLRIEAEDRQGSGKPPWHLECRLRMKNLPEMLRSMKKNRPLARKSKE